MVLLEIIVIIMALVLFSAICSGLNVSLMSLEVRDLTRKAKLGNVHAARVLPLRRKAHLVLSAIILTNVALISATSLVMGNHFDGLIAGIISTLLIVIFGEVFPQAIFMSRALTFTGRLSRLLWAMVIVTYPVSKLLQILLDKLIGEHGRKIQSRRELGLMIAEHLSDEDSELDEDEVEIMKGALSLSEKHVRDIMMPIKNVLWLTPDASIYQEKLDEIRRAGFSRIPVFDSRLEHFYGVILVKDLSDFDFGETAIRVSEVPLIKSQPVGSLTALDTMFRRFIAAKTHLIPVEKDDRIIGIATIEDLIEEIIGHEITDETDRRNHRQ